MQEIKKENREEYPNLKTITELKALKLMPVDKEKPDAILIYYTPRFSQKSTYLYDVNKTEKYKASDKEKAKRKAYYTKAKDKKEQEKIKVELKQITDELKQTIKPYQKVIFDTETTGLDFEKDEIIQFSAINEKGEILLNTYIKPTKKKAWPQAEAVNNISPEMVKDCKTIKEQFRDIQTVLLSATELIAYNINFDVNMLASVGFYIPDVLQTDVMIEFAEIYGEYNEKYDYYKWQKLTTCADYYGYKFNAHDSLEDVKATLYCYNKMRDNK